jgi:hypothetical protein
MEVSNVFVQLPKVQYHPVGAVLFLAQKNVGDELVIGRFGGLDDPFAQ